MASIGDDSKICVPATFMFVPGMPVVVTMNINPGLKLVNGAKYTALEVIPDTKRFPGYQLAPNIILHFGPPAGIILSSESTKKFEFDEMPPGTILLTPTSAQIPIEKKKRVKKRPWQRHNVSRRGLPCTAAFACTDYKIQGETLLQIALELRGTGTKLNNKTGQLESGKCDPYSLYVQLSRCKSLDGIMLLSKARVEDIVGNKIPQEMFDGEARLVQLCGRTVNEARLSLLRPSAQYQQ